MLTVEHPQRVEFDQPQNVNYRKIFKYQNILHNDAFIVALTVYRVFISRERERSMWSPSFCWVGKAIVLQQYNLPTQCTELNSITHVSVGSTGSPGHVPAPFNSVSSSCPIIKTLETSSPLLIMLLLICLEDYPQSIITRQMIIIVGASLSE